MSFLATAAVVGSVGGALISSGAQKSAQKKGLGIQQQGLAALDTASQDLLEGDPYQQFTAMLSRFAQRPETFSQSDLAGLKARYAEDAVGGAQAAQGAAWERAGAQGAYRDSSTRATERDIALRQGSMIAQGNRTVDEMAARQRSADIAQFGSLLQGLFNLRMGPAQSYANAAIGVGSNAANYGASPFGDALKGAGALAVGVGSSQRPYQFDANGNVIGGGGTAFGDLF